MTRRLKRNFAAVGVCCALSGPAIAARVTTVWDASFMGGQHYFEGSASEVSANAEVVVTPSVELSPRWSLVPTYSGRYQGSKDVLDFSGGGVPYRDSTNHSLRVKGVYHASSRWTLRPSLGGRAEWLRETREEKWGQGLFDNSSFSGGLDAECALTRRSGVGFGVDLYTLNFPNYQSLESNQDPTLARELAGADVLNSRNQRLYLSGWWPTLGRGRAEMTFSWTHRKYADQPVINEAGQPQGTDRGDKIGSLSWAVHRPHTLAGGEGLWSVRGGVDWVNANQNRFDAKKVFYIGDYYDYRQWSLSHSFSWSPGKNRWALTLGGGWQKRSYSERPTQDEEGNYLSEKTLNTQWNALGELSLPVASHIRFRFMNQWAWSHSNTRYDKVYQYNYRIANYLMGITYDY